VRRRKSLLGAGGLAALFAVLGPGILAGLSDDDPAGITTYSVLGAKYGYRLLWVLTLSTVALIVFHLLAARMGVSLETIPTAPYLHAAPATLPPVIAGAALHGAAPTGAATATLDHESFFHAAMAT